MEEIRINDKIRNESGVHSSLCVYGARTHNLRDVNVEIPRNRTTVISGPSGSGKSSLAFDTIFAEGQRQYVETLSTYSRQFLNQLARPDIDSISGLQPTVAIKQIPSEPNPRSTVATVAEIYDFLRLLFARVGVAHCYKCGRPIQRQSVEQIAQTIKNLPKDTRFILLAPVVREKLGAHTDVLKRLIKLGKTRARIDGTIVELADVPSLDPNKLHSIEAVIDRLILRDGIEARLVESLKLALKEGSGLVCCLYEKERQQTASGKTRSIWKDLLFSVRYSCPKCGVSYAELEPRSFNFNSPYGACRHCGGLGSLETFDPERLVADSGLSISEGALALGKGLSTASQKRLKVLLEDFEQLEPQAFKSPVSTWDERVRNLFFYGRRQDNNDKKEDNSLLKTEETFSPEQVFLDNNGGAEVSNEASDGLESTVDQEILDKIAKTNEETLKRQQKDKKNAVKSEAVPTQEPQFDGLVSVLEQSYVASKSVREREYLESFRGVVLCHDCGGARIRREARSVTVGDLKLNEVVAMSVSEALHWFNGLCFDELHHETAKTIISQIVSRLKTMERLRLEYLTLDRSADSLSGGELQRVRLTTALGNGLSGVCYILDEPTTGLHPRDTERLLQTFDSLKERNNTVLLVEHNEDVVRAADWLVDVGPGAGVNGGRIMAEGTPDDVAKVADSPTGLFLSKRDSIAVPKKRRKVVKTRSLVLDGVQTNNLKSVTFTLPLELFVCVTGVSGSGKSSLLNKTLVPALQKRLRNSMGVQYSTGEVDKICKFRSIRGASRIDKLVEITQSPIGRSARSNPATYSGAFDEIRKLFASTRDAKALGLKAGRFSFNISGGRCEECQGLGVQKVENLFLPDAYTTCPVCEGKRFNSQTLQVRYNNKTIADVLDMSFEEALVFFENHPALERCLKSFVDVGLGYLTLGQSSTSLSGGEAQRVKLATELARVDTGHTLYVLDEPTSGLHQIDVKKLLSILDNLVERGNTVVVIEHSTDVMKVADWIIDVGPEGGVNGGQIVATGTPEEIAALKDNATGRYLRKALGL